ncbi:sulfatase family protein [Nitrosopumilus sp.]|uniref:sulfatase family protein n=1 Tax=Nitrosopumilus sp. TaxID=2024843 RepID=UPI003D0B0E7B
MTPNIFFIIIDSLRADKFLGVNSTAITPNIDKLRKQGINFENVISPSDGTLLSWASLFTGLHPFKTGIKPTKQYNKLPSEIPTYFSVLKNQGYNTYGYIPSVSKTIGLFPKFENDDYSYDHYWNLSNNLGVNTVSILKSKKMQQPWAFFLHIMDLHFPIRVSKDFEKPEYGSNKYEQKLSEIDVWLGKFLEQIDLNSTLITITADHGTYVKAVHRSDLEINLEVNGSLQTIARNLGNKVPKPLEPLKSDFFFFIEKIRKRIKQNKVKNLHLKPHEERALLGQRSDLNHFLYDDKIHVPLLFVGHNIESGKKITNLVRTIDIFPTMFDIINIQNPNNNVDGRSVLPIIKGQDLEEQPAYMETHPLIERESTDVIGIRTSKFKYFRDNKDPKKQVHLYDLTTDPYEDENIKEKSPEIIDDMEQILQDLIKQKPKKSEEISDEETKKIEEELKKLGYL